MEQKIKRLNEILQQTCKSEKQYKFALNILKDILGEINIMRSKIHKKTDSEALTKLVKIIQAFGLTETDVLTVRTEFVDWIILNKKDIPKDMTKTNFNNTRTLYLNYCTQQGEEPENIEQLKLFYENLQDEKLQTD